jgi:hypothetical protein
VEQAPHFTNCRITLASAWVEMGRIDDARMQADEIRALMPSATSAAFSMLFDRVPALWQRRIHIADALGFAREP